ncbi:uncharacterized protein SRT_03690 [Streptococcus troglodytae]|uniref:Uncharacterized protein n=1 Tax=Streptococcus troglodytae TaxID=1111760 RepID=A0A1L7LHM4_9STRE|nr:hypothetical protein [Streptococcus troglodytae]BAQ23630.1 uncharacterized protein SRT_03690 [Streptococcus troglodytae]
MENNYISICEKGLLIKDLSLNQSILEEQADLIINNLTLNNEEFYKNKSTNLMSEPNKRLFRSPLITFSNYDLIPVFSFFESSKYFSYRILRTDILNKRNGKKWTELIKENFDERLLQI